MSEERQITIYVNTRPKTVTKNEEVTFERAVDLAYDGNPPSGPNVEITVMYQRAEGNKDGTLVPGGRPVKAKEGMILDVSATDRS
jgi:hypothetical protein